MKFWAMLIFLASAWLSPLQARPLVLSLEGEPETGFDPTLGWGSYGNPLFQSTLWTRDRDFKTQPDLAVDWSLSEDGLVWQMALRKDVRFSDGTALTAQDVAFTFMQAKKAAGPLNLEVLQSVEVLDDWSLRFTLSRPWITFVENFYTLGIVPAQSYSPDYGQNPIGSGPYQMVSWRRAEQLIVAENPYYYGPKSEFSQITFVFLGPDTALAAAQSGQIDLMALPARLWNRSVQGFHLQTRKSVDNRGLSLPFVPPQEGGRIGNAVTSDPAIRQAINLGLDRGLIAEVALFAQAEPAFGPADGLPWGPVQALRADLNQAQQVLDQAGWIMGADGIRHKGAQHAEFDIYYPASDSSRQALAEVTAELLRPLGIEARVKGASWEAIEQKMHQMPVIFGFGSHSPYEVFTLYSQSLAGLGYANPTFYSNPSVQAAFDRAQSASSLEASYPHWAEAAQYYGPQGDAAWAWLVNLDHLYLVNDCLSLGQGRIEPHGHGWPITADLHEWKWTCS